MNALSLEQCQDLLQEIREGRRHRLTGSEYKAIIVAVDNHRGDREDARLALSVVAMLARHEGPGSKAPFGDAVQNRVFNAESQRAGLAGDRRTAPAHVVIDTPYAAPFPHPVGDQVRAQRERNRSRQVPRPA
ncbi:hypothetical protein [Massilia sp. TWP1-3-3]|uniref:hypothetical protein n=1 Tax=Massilia sp. TWP1-3-3 TaxID=2804573 RepID=UPI003CF88AD2